MNTSIMMNVTTMQRHSCYADIPINAFGNINALMVQHHIFYANITMDVFAMVDVVTMQRHIFNANTSMDISTMMNVTTTQLGTSCSFDSPGLARNEPTLGKRSQRDATP